MPTVSINGGIPQDGPMLISITGQNSGAPAAPAAANAPHLQPLAPSGFSISSAIAYGSFPTGSGIYVDIGIPGTFTVTNNTVQFTAKKVKGLSITTQTSSGGSSTAIPLMTSNTIAVTNPPANESSNTPEADETLLGFLGVSPSVPSGATPPAVSAGLLGDFGNGPTDPGCSNSQWP
jgi:hypothetical protein